MILSAYLPKILRVLSSCSSWRVGPSSLFVTRRRVWYHARASPFTGPNIHSTKEDQKTLRHVLLVRSTNQNVPSLWTSLQEYFATLTVINRVHTNLNRKHRYIHIM